MTRWWGKIVGGACGFLFGGPVGGLLGAGIGHQFDRHSNRTENVWRAKPGAQVQDAFFTAVFSIMGHLAKSDGRVSESEIKVAEAIMSQMELRKNQRERAIKLFHEGKQADFQFDLVMRRFCEETGRRPDLMRLFLEIQVQAALADGEIRQSERRILHKICQLTGVSKFDYAQLEALVRMQYAGGTNQRHYQRQPAGRDTNRLQAAYQVLGVGAEANEADIKKAYRRLISQHHPDKLAAKGLPEEMMKLATDKTHEIKSAYEHIRQARGFAN